MSWKARLDAIERKTKLAPEAWERAQIGTLQGLTNDALPWLIEGFRLLVKEHEAAGRMIEGAGERKHIVDHDNAWLDVDMFLRGVSNERK